MQSKALRRMPLPQRTSTMFYLGMALVAVMLGIVAWTLYDGFREARRNAQKDAANIALTLERDIEREFASLDLALRAAIEGMATPGLATMDPKIRQLLLFDGALVAEDRDGVVITDRDGWQIYDSRNPVAKHINIAERDYFKAQRDHADLGLVISPPVRKYRDGAWSIIVSRRITGPDGTFAGVAMAGLPISYLQSLFDGLALGEHGGLTVVSTDHQTLIARRPYDEQEIGRDLSGSEVMKRLPDGPSGEFEARSKIDGVRRIYAYRKLAGLPIVLAVGLSTEETDAAWIHKAIILGGVLLLLCSAVLCLAWALPRELRLRARAEAAARHSASLAEQASAELAQALAPLEALFRNSADTMLVIGVGADGSFRYEAVNPVWESLTGVAATAAIGQMPRTLIEPEIARKMVGSWRKCVSERQPVRLTLAYPPGTGREWDIMGIPVMEADGTVSRLVVVGREITERNRLEEDLRQRQKMEVIGRLAAGVSHDFNNILQVIAGGIELMNDETSLSAEARSFLDMVDKATRRGSYLTHHLLSYSRKQTLVPKRLDLREILESLTAILSRTLGTDIAVSSTVADQIGFVRADRSQLETALMNLAINASHARPGGGTLRFEVARAEAEPFGELDPGRYLVISVTDNGSGMAPDVLACIFDPFFTTKGLEGTGLGLAMVQGFCRQSGGDVRAKSKPGEGTTFELWLPEIEAEAPQGNKRARPGPIEPVGHVLLVDDAQDVLTTVGAFLRTGGFTVYPASGGKQALSALASGEHFDLLITDYMMPSMKGPELIREARQLQPDLPALVISGYADVAEFLADLPGTVLLKKPFRRDDLISQASAQIARARHAAVRMS